MDPITAMLQFGPMMGQGTAEAAAIRAQQQTAAAQMKAQQQPNALQQAQIQEIQGRGALTKQKLDAANSTQTATQDLKEDLDNGTDIMDAIQDHPDADPKYIHSLIDRYRLEQQQKENDKKAAKEPAAKGAMDFAAPGQQDAQNSALVTRFTGIPLNDPVINQVLGTNAPPGTGTNRLSSAQAALKQATPAQPAQSTPSTPENVGKTPQTAYKPTTEEEVQSLPDGAYFINPADGKVYRKKASTEGK